jgi:hypothetical protein
MPTNYNPRRVLFVHAATDTDALGIAHRQIEIQDGIAYSEHVWLGVELAKPAPSEDTLQSVLRAIRNSPEWQTSGAQLQLLLALQRFCTDEIAKTIDSLGIPE